jgi:ABC-type proline/glycine betaine transport system permease subunit
MSANRNLCDEGDCKRNNGQTRLYSALQRLDRVAMLSKSLAVVKPIDKISGGGVDPIERHCAHLILAAIGLALGLLPTLLAIPVHWIARQKFAILLKVVASWVIAIASLALFVSVMPTPGYKPDHME